MNIVVIGLGSMGKRRIRLIKEMYPDYSIFGIDQREDRRAEAEKDLGVKTSSSMDTIQEKTECAFVCTSPLSHAKIIAECLKHKWHVFTELNLVSDAYEDNMKLAKENNCKLFLSSTFFYREEIKYIRSKITEDKKWNYIYHIGQYLPDWHPWEYYRCFFVGDKRTNGCREILAIELPWLTGAFGEVADTKVISDKMTGLAIQYDDNFMIQLTHANGNKGVLIVDIVSPCAVRKLEAYAEGRYLAWNGTPESLMEYNIETGTLESVGLSEKTEHREGYRAFVVENSYKNEIREFFEVVLHDKPAQYGFEQDQKVIELIDSLGA